ncbi:Structural maintenance of chromosomes protein 6, partial [Tulasnella sp. 417]
AQIDELTDKSKALEEQLNTDKEDNGKHEAERKALQEQIKRNALKIQECQSEEKDINQNINNVQKLIDDLEQKIEAESRKLERDEAAKRQQLMDQLGEVASRLTAKEEAFQALGREKQDLETRARSLQEQLKNATNDRNRVQQQLQDVQGWQNQLQNQQQSKLNAFGTNIGKHLIRTLESPRPRIYGKFVERILQEIDNTGWRGSTPPLGPLGRYVTLKDSTYREVLQNQIGGSMYQFVVSHPADRQVLGQILKRHSNQAPIVIAERDIFDFSRGLPQDRSIVTPLDVLEFSDDWVPRILVNAHSLERIGLTKTRAEADHMAERDPGRIFWSADQFRVTKYKDGGFSSQIMPELKRTDRRRLLFTVQDTAAQLRDAQEREQQLRHELDVIMKHGAKTDRALQEADQKRNNLFKQGRVIQTEISGLQRQKGDLEDLAKEEAPQEVAVLEGMRSEHITDKEKHMAAFQMVYERRLQLDGENKPLVEKAKMLRDRVEQANEANARIHAEMSRLFDQTCQARSNHKHYRDKLAEAERKVTEHNEKLAVTEEEYTAWHAKASEYCTEVMNPRNSDLVRKEVEALEKAVKQRERRQGASVDEMEAECVRTKRALEKTNAAIKGLEEMAQKLDYAVKIRIETWHTFRRNIALRTKAQFGFHLAVRSFIGHLHFDHVKSTLNLSVMTADQAQAQGTQRAKEARSLSG